MRLPSMLGAALVASTLAAPAAAAFDAHSFFKYIDKSCDVSQLNVAGEDMTAMVDASVKSFSSGWSALSVRTFLAYFGKISEDIDTNSGLQKIAYNKLNTLESGKYSIWCDGTAMKWVETQQEGADKGKPFEGGDGRFYLAPDRRPKDSDFIYIKSQKRDDFCTLPDSSKRLEGASVPGLPYIFLCPSAFTEQPVASLVAIQDKVQPAGTMLDKLSSPGGVLLHEFAHAVLGYPAAGEIYSAVNCIAAAQNKATMARTRRNADTIRVYSMATYLSNNAWVLAFAQAKTAYDEASGSSGKRGLKQLEGRKEHSTAKTHTTSTSKHATTKSEDKSSTVSTTAAGATSAASASKTGSAKGSSTHETGKSKSSPTSKTASQTPIAEITVSAFDPVEAIATMPAKSAAYYSSIIVHEYTISTLVTKTKAKTSGASASASGSASASASDSKDSSTSKTNSASKKGHSSTTSSSKAAGATSSSSGVAAGTSSSGGAATAASNAAQTTSS